MKYIILSLTMLLFALTANAQFNRNNAVNNNIGSIATDSLAVDTLMSNKATSNKDIVVIDTLVGGGPSHILYIDTLSLKTLYAKNLPSAAVTDSILTVDALSGLIKRKHINTLVAASALTTINIQTNPAKDSVAKSVASSISGNIQTIRDTIVKSIATNIFINTQGIRDSINKNIKSGNGISRGVNNDSTILGGILNQPTKITTTAINTFSIAGLQSGATTDSILTIDTTGKLKRVTPSVLGASLWSLNSTGNIFNTNQANKVGIGTNNPQFSLDVVGRMRTSLTSSSDIRFKKNIVNIDGALDKVLKLNGVYYDWRTEEFKERKFKNGRDIGLIAQDVEKVMPEVVDTDESAQKYKSIEYSKIVALVIEAIKEQNKVILKLSQENKELKANIESRLQKLENKK